MMYTMERNGDGYDLEIRKDVQIMRLNEREVDELMEKLLWYAETLDRKKKEDEDENTSPTPKRIFEKYRDIRNDVQTIHTAQEKMEYYIRGYRHQVHFARLSLERLLANARSDLRLHQHLLEDRLQGE